jgi:integrase
MGMSPYKTRKLLRDELIIRMLYETFARVSELCKANIEDLDFETRTLIIKYPKGKYNRRTGETVREPRHTFFSEDTKELLLRALEGRTRGPIFLNKRGDRVNTRLCERVVDHYARVLEIQKVLRRSKRGRAYKKPRYLITCKALREAGETHTDMNGADSDITSRIAGHSRRTKEQYYKTSNLEEMREHFEAHHPLARDKGAGK